MEARFTVLLRYLVAAIAVVLALLLKLLLNPVILGDSPFLVFFAAITISAWYGGLGPGIVATTLAALFSATFFLPPSPSLAIASPGNQVRLILFLVEGGLISGLSGALRNARLRAEAAVHTRDQFLSIAAHELKTPLTTLLGYTQVLQGRAALGTTLGERDQRAVQTISQQAIRLHRLIDSLLDLSRIHSGGLSVEWTVVDMAALVQRVVDEMRPTLDQHVIEFSGLDESLCIAGDELRLEQVIQNLLHNAVKYSPDGGTITVRVEQDYQQVCITVSDQGIGIPEQARDQIFQRFFRAENAAARRVNGMGIGLYMVKEIVALHGGTVVLASTTARGSTFRVRIPMLIPRVVEAVAL